MAETRADRARRADGARQAGRALPRRARVRRTIAAALAGVFIAGIVVSGFEGGPAKTDASWADQEYGTGAITALTVQKAVISSCSYAPGLLGATPTVTIQWSLPAGSGLAVPANVAYGVSAGNVVSGLATALLGSTLTTTPSSGGESPQVYTTVYGSGLLGGLLGSTYTVGVQTTKNGWTAPFARAVATAGALGSNPSCAIQPG